MQCNEKRQYGFYIMLSEEEIADIAKREGIKDAVDKFCATNQYKILFSATKYMVKENFDHIELMWDDSINREIKNCIIVVIVKIATEQWIKKSESISEVIKQMVTEQNMQEIAKYVIRNVIEEKFADAEGFWEKGEEEAERWECFRDVIFS